MRDDYLQAALKIVGDPNVLVNLVSVRVKQLKRGVRALVESLEKLQPEDTALREIAEGKIAFELGAAEEFAPQPSGNGSRGYGVRDLHSAGPSAASTATHSPVALRPRPAV